MPDRAHPLAGVRAFLLDLDGVIVLAEKPVPGAAEAIGALAARRIPFRIVTNTSLVSRATLSRWGASMGAPIPPDRFQSALSVSAAYTARHFRGQPLYVLTSDDARVEFDGQRLLTDEEASKPDARAAAVIVGDAPEAATWQNMNRAFRLIRNGAVLLGMHKNRWWLTPDGPTIDSGSYVAGLEFASGIRAKVLGKPAREFFTEAATALAAEARAGGQPALRRRDIAMVGDDLDTDVRAAQRAGLRGVFVLSGKHTRDDLGAATRRGRPAPDFVAESLAEVVAALD
ncbi:MAG TPA: HAD-IIA family hydrolase [Candidatus Limnocylindrales bacterium]|nr:HAD-IIA family hydrolase [Candidatus Limnocylindrales bacterium]